MSEETTRSPIKARAVEITVSSGDVALSGTMLLPAGESRIPCVVIAGGTMSHTRDGGMIAQGREAPERDALKRLAERLAAAGYASIRWDKRGYGATPPGPRPTTNEDETSDLIAMLQFARRHPGISGVVAAGESAGAYFACQAAREGVPADAYVLLGAWCGYVEDLYEYNYGRLKAYAEQDGEKLRWAEEASPYGLALGRRYTEMIRAARRGDDHYLLEHGGRKWDVPLARMKKEIQDPPPDQFRYLSSPVLVLHGDMDMNVPPRDAAETERIIRDSGNPCVSRIMIPHADHSFQMAAPEHDLRMQERHSFASFNRPYNEDLYTALVAWLYENAPTPLRAAQELELPKPPSPRPGFAAWEGINIAESITDTGSHTGVDTLEGRIGPLLKGESCQAHYIEMPAGLYLAEHPHSSESLIYTVSGSWVLCSGGVRKILNPGSLFWFGAGTPTGYEVPFDNNAFILIFKGQLLQESDEAFLEYLRGLAGRLEKEQDSGTPFNIRHLPREHPARLFARRACPRSGY